MNGMKRVDTGLTAVRTNIRCWNHNDGVGIIGSLYYGKTGKVGPFWWCRTCGYIYNALDMKAALRSDDGVYIDTDRGTLHINAAH